MPGQLYTGNDDRCGEPSRPTGHQVAGRVSVDHGSDVVSIAQWRIARKPPGCSARIWKLRSFPDLSHPRPHRQASDEFGVDAVGSQALDRLLVQAASSHRASASAVQVGQLAVDQAAGTVRCDLRKPLSLEGGCRSGSGPSLLAVVRELD